jgi:hypothetical protein
MTDAEAGCEGSKPSGRLMADPPGAPSSWNPKALTQRVRRTAAGLAPSASGAEGEPPRRLMSATAVHSVAGFVTATFVAAVVRDEEELRACVARHCGRRTAASADVRSGFDQFDPIAAWLVSERTADLLAAASLQPVGSDFRGLLVVLSQRVVE